MSNPNPNPPPGVGPANYMMMTGTPVPQPVYMVPAAPQHPGFMAAHVGAYQMLPGVPVAPSGPVQYLPPRVPEAAPSPPSSDPQLDLSPEEGAKMKLKWFKCSETPPCGHNQWARNGEAGARVKKKRPVLLRCMVCEVIWKTKLRQHQKCPKFFQGVCEEGAACPFPHVYSAKKSRGQHPNGEQTSTNSGGCSDYDDLPVLEE